jgi:hypothetical protein
MDKNTLILTRNSYIINNMKTVLISSPCLDFVHSIFCFSLTQNLLNLSAEYPCRMTYNPIRGTYLHNSREYIVNYALEMNASHIIWVDTDMEFPHNAFQRLLRHELDFVGVNYSTRAQPFRFTAGRYELDKQGKLDFNQHSLLVTDQNSKGLEKVNFLGFGLCLTSVDLVKKLDPPYFRISYNQSKKMIGEDVQFCQDVQKYTDIYVDQDLSKEVKHIGTYSYGYTTPLKAAVNNQA